MEIDPATATLRHYKGTISLFSPNLPVTQTNDPQPGHVTLLTPSEYKSLDKPSLESIASVQPLLQSIYLIGEANTKGVKFVVVSWNNGNKWRKSMGLPRKDFHVTLSEVDDWEIEDRMGLVIRQDDGRDGGLIERISALGAGGMDSVVAALGTAHRDFRRQIAEKMIERHPDYSKGFVWLAETSRHFLKLRMLALAQAVTRQPSLLSLVVPQIARLRDKAAVGPTCTSAELDSIPPSLRSVLIAPWPRSLLEDDKLRSTLWTCATVPRDRQICHMTAQGQGEGIVRGKGKGKGREVRQDIEEEQIGVGREPGLGDRNGNGQEREEGKGNGQEQRLGPGLDLGLRGPYELPRFFSWVYPFRIAGMSTPRNSGDIDALIALGFTDILTLTEETPLPQAWFFRKKIRHLYVPLPNYGAPTTAEMDIIYERIKERGVWMVHCGGGVGRAGTVLACLIAMFGETRYSMPTPKLDAGTAIRLLRASRPRSLESDSQETFVSSWVSHRWKLLITPTVDEPMTGLRDSDIQGEPLDPNVFHGVVLVMIGKPGSGKSWLSECIARRRPRGTTIIISQDECGSRAMCETELSRQHPPSTLVILDRCNPTRADRQTWLKLTDRRAIAVYFDYDKAVCKQRIDKRLNHPTIRAGRGGNALDQMDREMEPPTLVEKFGSIIRISSVPAARAAVLHLSPPFSLLKFPRTPHLLNLGSTGEDDIVLDIFDKATGKLEGKLTIEEKIDGANMGISLSWDMGIVVQNRSHYIHAASHAQFKSLDTWLDKFRNTLTTLLLRDQFFPERYILYGEWMVAKHSVHYTNLPDRFIAFDLYDRATGLFVSRGYLDKVLAGTGIAQVPMLAQVDGISKAEILEMIQRPSAFSAGAGGAVERMEGVYVRFEDDERRVTTARGKVVRGDFIAGNDHWTKGKMVWNGIRREDDAEF